MNRSMIIAAAVMLTAPLAGAAYAQMGASNEDLITQAVAAAPEELRAGATVINYDAKGDPVVLRQGNNGIVCNPNQQTTSYSVQCYAQVLKAQHDLQAKDRAEGKDAKAIGADVQAAMASGKLPKPPVGTAMYTLSGKTKESARGMWVVLVPGMTAEQSGLPTKPTAAGTPWLMRAGTPAAHIHIPQRPANEG